VEFYHKALLQCIYVTLRYVTLYSQPRHDVRSFVSGCGFEWFVLEL